LPLLLQGAEKGAEKNHQQHMALLGGRSMQLLASGRRSVSVLAGRQLVAGARALSRQHRQQSTTTTAVSAGGGAAQHLAAFGCARAPVSTP
jgi:phosphoserine phosphatase